MVSMTDDIYSVFYNNKEVRPLSGVLKTNIQVLSTQSFKKQSCLPEVVVTELYQSL